MVLGLLLGSRRQGLGPPCQLQRCADGRTTTSESHDFGFSRPPRNLKNINQNQSDLQSVKFILPAKGFFGPKVGHLA